MALRDDAPATTFAVWLASVMSEAMDGGRAAGVMDTSGTASTARSPSL